LTDVFAEKSTEFIKTLDNQEVKEDKLTLTCDLNKHDAKVTWLKDGKVITPDDRVTVSMETYTHQLVVAKATLEDAGKYSCKCGDVSTECTINVQGQ